MKGNKVYVDLGTIFDEIFDAARNFSDEFQSNFNRCDTKFGDRGPFAERGPFSEKGPFERKAPSGSPRTKTSTITRAIRIRP
jgi:hypothetical protein